MSENLTPSPNNRNTVVGGRVWRFVQVCTKAEYKLWVADYFCADGDGVELYIANDHFELSCFSGIGNSVIKMSDLDFIYLQDKVLELDFREPFEVQAVKVADYFCRMLCEYRSVS